MTKFGGFSEETAPTGDDLVVIKENASGASKRVQLTNILPTGSVTTAKLADGSVTSAKAATGYVVQEVGTDYSAVSTGTATIPIDDTIPQNTEGTEFMTQTITPKSSSNTLVIEAVITCSYSVATWIQAAMFQDATANAIAATGIYQASTAGFVNLTLRKRMTAGTTSATTFKVRAGGDSAGTITFNGSGGTRRYGGITLSSMVIREIKA